MKGKIWKKVIFIIGVIGILVFSFWYGGNAPGLQGFSVTEQTASESGEENVRADVGKSDGKSYTDSEVVSAEDTNLFQQIVMNIKLKSKASDSSKKSQNSKQAQKNASKVAEKESKKKKATTEEKSKKKKTETTTEAKKENSQNANSESDKETTTEEKKSEDTIQCTVYISCATVLDNMDRLPAAKKSMIPKDGVILKETAVRVKKDATVFDALQQAAKENKIHLEYTYTPVYKSYYIEGIYNLYEFDCGNTSGWMYSVNGEFPGGSSSLYDVEDGDVIQWLYSCDLGKDVGRYFDE